MDKSQSRDLSKTNVYDMLRHGMEESVRIFPTNAIDEGVKGVSSAAESTQTLVSDMDNITKRMDENQRIVSELDDETAIFTKI